MRRLGFLVAVSATLAAPPVAGPARSDLPGIGTFSYSGTAVAPPAPALVLAGLTRADRS